MNSKPSSRPGSVQIINGFKAKWISLRLFMSIFFMALNQKSNLFEAIRNFRKVGKRLEKIQGLKRIPRFIKCVEKYYWAEQIPGWPSKQFNRFFEGELLRCNPNRRQKAPLNTIIFSITSRCALQCSHCFDWDNLAREEHLGLEQLLVILKKLEKLGLTHIQFSGGEPLARFDDLITLIEAAKHRMDCWVLTSGFGLTYEKALKLKQAGLTGASISLDHWDENFHNEFRNNSKSYFWVKEAVKNCREAGIITTLAVCATKNFVTNENLKQYFELAKSWGAGFIKILEPRQTGRFRDKDIKLNSAQIELLIDFYRKSYSDSTYQSHPNVVYPGFDQRQVGCLGAGNRYLYIDSKGEIHACPFCHGSVGNALDLPWEEAITKLRIKGCEEYGLCTLD